MPGIAVRKTLVNIICPCSKMNHPLRDKIARQMWQMWSEANRPHLDGVNCPREFYQMAEIAMICLTKELDNMMLDIVKNRLEGIYNLDEDSPPSS